VTTVVGGGVGWVVGGAAAGVLVDGAAEEVGGDVVGA